MRILRRGSKRYIDDSLASSRGERISSDEAFVILSSLPPEALKENGRRRIDPLILGSLTLIGLTEEELIASDRRLKRAGVFEVPRGSIVALLAPTRGGLARLTSIGRVILTATMRSDSYSAYSPSGMEDVEELDRKLMSFLGLEKAVTPLERVRDGYLIIAENVLKPGILFPGMGELPDEGYLITERWLELAGLKGGISGLWGRIWGRLFVLEPRDGLVLMLGLLASSPTLEELITEGNTGALEGLSSGEAFRHLLETEMRRIEYMGWHLMRGRGKRT